jgi:hypothetical protein
VDLDAAKIEFARGGLEEVMIEPAQEANGWMVVVREAGGKPVQITDHGGAVKVYHTLEHATEVARAIGFATVRVEESF